MLNNDQLKQAVRDELSFDPSFVDGEIAVAANAGMVSLSGYVPNFTQKRLAGRAAQRVAGVRQVKDEIVVRLPEDMRSSDEEIGKRASKSLAWDVSVPADVKANVDKGFVTLTGEAEYGFERTAAEYAVGGLHGVTGVSNKIELKPSGSTAGIAASITKALDRLGFDGKSMTVSAEDSRVTLKGTVPTAHQRELAERTAWSAPGVTQVETYLSIN